MNLFEINYLNKITALYKEAFLFKKYKAMNAGLAVLSGILMIPFVVASFMVTCVCFSLAFPFEVISSLVKSLHTILKDEGRDVKHATQVILYWLSWPIVFALYVAESAILALIVPTYALLSFLVYVWSFGGIRLQLFASVKNELSVDVEGRYKALPIVFVTVGYGLNFLLPLIHGAIYYVYLYFQYNEAVFIHRFSQGIYPKYYRISLLFIFIFSLIMASYPKKRDFEQ